MKSSIESRKLGATGISRPNLIELRDVAVSAAHAAGKVLLRRFRTRLRISEKPGAGIVTNADLEAEKAALRVLKRAYPSFGVLAEESGHAESKDLGRWILDPLDGTSNYAHGLPIFCVSLAAEWNGEVVVGAIFHPVLGETYTAVLGKGAFVNGRRMKVSATKDLRQSFLSTGFSSATRPETASRSKKEKDKDRFFLKEATAFERLNRLATGIRRPGSAALDLACVARGSFDGFWERGLSPWDIAAGKLMIEEAGGKVTDYSGSSDCLSSGEILCSNGTLHKHLLKEILAGSSR